MSRVERLGARVRKGLRVSKGNKVKDLDFIV